MTRLQRANVQQSLLPLFSDITENADERTPEGSYTQKVTQSHTLEEAKERAEDETRDIDQKRILIIVQTSDWQPKLLLSQRQRRHPPPPPNLQETRQSQM